MAYFKAGLVLEEAVSHGLNELGIAHRRTAPWGEEDVKEAVDFVIPPQHGRPAFEIQLTLMRKHERKRMDFALAALSKRARGIRVYLEVVASHRREDLARVGRRVAQAIQTIVTRLRNFGPYNLLGASVNAKNGAIQKFDLVLELGVRLKEAARRLLERIEAARATPQANETPVPILFHLGVCAHKAAELHRASRCAPPRPPAPIRRHRFPTRRPFLPRRFC
ncbi:hypothetical protein HY631_04140 [Candidatus Uhrbacteria bacterium]|nr:hypothetical protein [Candidatus Uhrbacteria bacterium]